MDAESVAKIDASRERLRRFVESIKDEELTRPVEGDWTAAAPLAHPLLGPADDVVGQALPTGRLWAITGELDAVNESELPQWRLIPSRAAAQAALQVAADIDGLLPGESVHLLAAMRTSKINYDRSNHRNATSTRSSGPWAGAQTR